MRLAVRCIALHKGMPCTIAFRALQRSTSESIADFNESWAIFTQHYQNYLSCGIAVTSSLLCIHTYIHFKNAVFAPRSLGRFVHKNKNTILIIDDDAQIRKMVTLVLEDENFKIIECDTGQSAVRLSASAKPDLILLDLGLPDMDGRDVVTALRQWCQAPIIILSGRSSDKDVIELLNHGADDYVTKPFNIDMLRARINASLRKSAIHETRETEIKNGPLRMDMVRHQVFLGDERIALTPKEYSLLKYFIVHRGKMLSHRDILREIWGSAHSDDTQYLRVFVGQLREKLEQNPAVPTIITTELGIGYRMEFLHDLSPHKQGESRI